MLKPLQRLHVLATVWAIGSFIAQVPFIVNLFYRCCGARLPREIRGTPTLWNGRSPRRRRIRTSGADRYRDPYDIAFPT